MAHLGWQEYLAASLALRLGQTREAHNLAALIVVGLDNKYGLAAVMEGVSLSDPHDINDPERVPAAFYGIVQGVYDWARASQQPPPSEGAVKAALTERAVVSYLSLKAPDIARARKIGQAASGIVWGGTRTEFETGDGSWNGLREELVSVDPASVAAYSTLLTNATLRTSLVKKFQTWATAKGTYVKRIDGLWGDGSEAAFVAVVPKSARRLSTLIGWRTLLSALQSDLPDENRVVALAAVIARDKWLAANPSRMATSLPEASPPSGESGSPPYTTVPSVSRETEPNYSEETIVLQPDDSGIRQPTLTPLPNGDVLDVTKIDAIEERLGTPSWMWWVAGGAAAVGVVLLLRRKS